MQDSDLEKTRGILFNSDPSGQAEKAFSILSRIGRLSIKLCEDSHGLTVAYNLQDHTLRGLDGALVNQGFVLEVGLIAKAKRAIIYYEEEIQLANAKELSLQEKKKEIFTHVYEHHKHGDRDDTPPEWREYK